MQTHAQSHKLIVKISERLPSPYILYLNIQTAEEEIFSNINQRRCDPDCGGADISHIPLSGWLFVV